MERHQDPRLLLCRLRTHTLDRTFEAFGNFVLNEGGATRFWGNFFDYSHVFDIAPTDKRLIKRLTAAIRANQRKPEYLSQETYADRKARECADQLRRDAIRDAERLRQARAIVAAAGRG